MISILSEVHDLALQMGEFEAGASDTILLCALAGYILYTKGLSTLMVTVLASWQNTLNI